MIMAQIRKAGCQPESLLFRERPWAGRGTPSSRNRRGRVVVARLRGFAAPSATGAERQGASKQDAKCGQPLGSGQVGFHDGSLPPTSIEQPLAKALAKGLLERDLHRVKPTVRGFDFLSDLQSLFLPA